MSERQLNIKIGVPGADESGKKVKAFAGELAKAEAAAGRFGKGGAAGLGAVSDKLRALADIGVPGLNRVTSGLDSASTAMGAFGGKAGLAIAGAAGLAVAFGALAAKAVQAASEGEQASTRLNAALKAQGLGFEGNAEAIGEWAEALLVSKGVSDELSATLVAQGVTMGLTIDKSQEFVSLAADMAPIVGSLEGAFDLLSRAATGDERAMKSLGKQFGIVVDDGTKLADVLEQVAQKTDGNAAARIHTFAGEWQLFNDQVGNLLEEKGTPLLHFLTELLRLANESKDGVKNMGDAFVQGVAPGIAFYMKLAEAAGIFADEAARGANIVSSMASGHVPFGATVQSHGAPQAPRARFRLGSASAPGESVDASNFLHNRKREAEEGLRIAKAAADEEKQIRERMYGQVFDLVEQDIKRAQDTLAQFYSMTTRAELATRQQIELERQRNEMQTRLTGGDMFGPSRTDLWGETEATFGPGIPSEIAAHQEEVHRAWQKQMQIETDIINDENNRSMDVHKIKMQSLADSAAMAQAIIGTVRAFASGNIGGGISGMGGMLAMSTGNPWFALGGSVFGEIINSLNAAPRSEGGQARKDLRGLLKGNGIYAGPTTDWNDTTGVTDAWANLLTGSDKGGGTGAMLKDSLDELGLSMGEAADKVGDLLEESEGLDQFTADMQAASSAFMTTQNLTREEIEQLATLYGSAANAAKRRNELQTQIEADLSAFGGATGQEREDIINRLDANQDELSKLLTPQEKTADATQTSAAHLGTLVSYFTGQTIPSGTTPTNADPNTGRTTPPPPGGSGGKNITINVSGAVGDHRDIARKIHREILTLQGQRAV